MAINKVSAGRGAAWINESITSLRTGGKTIWVPALLVGLLGSIPGLNILQGLLIIFFYASLVICISRTESRSSVLSGFQNGNLNRLLPITLLNIAFAIVVVAMLWPTLKVAVEATMQGTDLSEAQAIALVKSMLEHFIWLVPACVVMHWLTQFAVPLASLGGLSGTTALQQAAKAILSNLPALLVNLICLFIVMCLVVIIFAIPMALVGAATAGNTLLSNLFLIPITTVLTAIMLALLSGNMVNAYRDVFGQAEPVTKDSELLI